MSNKKENNKKAFLAAMEITYGNISDACKICGIHKDTPQKWKLEDEEFKSQMYSDSYAESFKDMIESGLRDLAIEKDKIILMFLAKTKVKDRGYIESTRIEYTNDTPTPVTREEVEESVKRIAAMMDGKLTVTKKIA